MISETQYKTYYEFINNNILKMKQTYKYFNDYLNIDNIHFLIELLSTWEFDDKWIKNNMSSKIKGDNKDEIRNEFYNSLISNITICEENLEEYNICGFYSLSNNIIYKITNEMTIQKQESRKIIIDKNKSNQSIILTFFLVYHMLIVGQLISDKGISLKIEELKKEFNDELSIINLCKNITRDIIFKDIDNITDINEVVNKYNIPSWYIENYIKYKKA